MSVNLQKAEFVRSAAKAADFPRDRLAAYSLTITSIAQMIAAQNVEGSGGSISENDTTYSITTSGEYTSLDDIRNTVVAYKTTAGNYGTTAIPSVQKILLRDIADVYEGYKSVSSLAYRNGTPCVILSIQKQSGKNSVQTARQVRKQVESIQPLLPVDVTLTEEWNTTDIIETSINNIISAVLHFFTQFKKYDYHWNYDTGIISYYIGLDEICRFFSEYDDTCRIVSWCRYAS